MFPKGPKKGVAIILFTVMVGMGGYSPGSTVFAEGASVVQENVMDNTLSKLEIQGVTLDQPFSPAVKEYTVTVENTVQSVMLYAASNNPKAIITVNDLPINSDEPQSLPLQIGENPFVIHVSDENQTENTYSLTITREKNADDNPVPIEPDANDTPASSVPNANSDPKTSVPAANSMQNNRSNVIQPTAALQGNMTVQKVSKAKLSSLTVSDGTWDSAFSADEFTYHIAVSKETDTITIHPKASYSSSTIEIEEGTSETIKLDEDNKTVVSVVVTYDDDDRKTYVLVIDRDGY